MPYASDKQRAFMHAEANRGNPQMKKITQRWDSKYGGKVQPGIAVGERNPSGESSSSTTFPTKDRIGAINRRLGLQKPGRKSQPRRSPQVRNLVNRMSAKQQLSEAGNHSTLPKQKKKMEKREAVMRRQMNRKVS